MTAREMYQEYKRLLDEKGMYKLDGIDTNSNKSMLQNGIDCLNCTDEMLNDYLVVLKLAYPNTYNKIANNGDFKKHSFNRLYVFNTARSILRGVKKMTNYEKLKQMTFDEMESKIKCLVRWLKPMPNTEIDYWVLKYLISELRKQTKQRRVDKMSNEVEINKKEYLCENGITYLIPENHCPFCKHCASIFYDYTHGPYMFLCEVANGDPETCEKFEKR